MTAYDLAYRAKSWRTVSSGYIAAVWPVVLFFVVRQQFLSAMLQKNRIFTDNPLWAADFWTARLTALKVLGKYLFWEDWQPVVSLTVSSTFPRSHSPAP